MYDIVCLCVRRLFEDSVCVCIKIDENKRNKKQTGIRKNTDKYTYIEMDVKVKKKRKSKRQILQ